ncbi:MAG: hypothetical protein U0900_22135 [Myxococcota bacterium]
MGGSWTRGPGRSGDAPRAQGALGTPYEVRCPRCDVSFPVETRRCIHCGGATSAAGAAVPVAAFTGSVGSASGGRSGPAPPPPIPIAGGDASDAPEEAVPQQGIGAALLRSFGSLFWVVALIGFTLLQRCKEG